MATNSIYKQMRVKNKNYCRNFIAALENAENKSGKVVVPSTRSQEIKGELLRKMFGN